MLQSGRFRAARSAPACPERDDDVAAAEVGEGDGMAVEGGKRESRSGLVKRSLAVWERDPPISIAFARQVIQTVNRAMAAIARVDRT